MLRNVAVPFCAFTFVVCTVASAQVSDFTTSTQNRSQVKTRPASRSIGAQEEPSVSVTVYETLDRRRAIYHYAVTNHSDRPITTVTVGMDPETGDYSLSPPPSGWTPDNGIVARSIGTPAGWTAEVHDAEESPNVSVWWRTAKGTVSAIAPGKTLDGFTLVVAVPTDLYHSTGWQVVDDRGDSTRGVLKRVKRPR
jgi:hypothetical protein